MNPIIEFIEGVLFKHGQQETENIGYSLIK